MDRVSSRLLGDTFLVDLLLVTETVLSATAAILLTAKRLSSTRLWDVTVDVKLLLADGLPELPLIEVLVFINPGQGLRIHAF